MTASILTSGILFLSSLLNVTVPQPSYVSILDDVEWSCGEIQWVKDTPKWSGSNFYGSISVDCRFIGNSGGGFEEAQPYLVKKLETEAKEVHAGPEKVTFEDKEGVMMETTVVIGEEGKDNVEVRQVSHIAHDDDILVSESKSKSVKGTGYGKYLKAIDNRFEITFYEGKDARDNEYAITVSADFELKKPFLIPRGIFEREVKKAIQNQAKDVQKLVIEDVAQHI